LEYVKFNKETATEFNSKLLVAPSYDDNSSKKVDHEIEEAQFKFIASVNRQL